MPPPPHHWGIPPPPPHPGDGKRKAPISAGAFAFDLSKIGTPQKKPRTVISAPNELQTPSRQFVTPAPRPPTTSKTPQRKLSVAPFGEHATSACTPLKQAKPLGALPSPFITPARANTTPDLKHRPLQSIMDDASPFVSRPRTSALKEGEKLVKLGELSAGKVDASPRERLKREDEGVGVSPRKPKAIKWTGKGDMPTSVHLAQVLHTANSSLVLFYNSLQRTLHPPARPPKPAFGGKTTSPDRTPTVVQHIRTAHIHLRPTSLAWDRTHNGIVLSCDVVKRKDPAGETMLLGGPGQGGETREEDEAVLLLLQPAPHIHAVLLLLQPAPHECARLGVDPKVVVGKMREGSDKRWEIGVWAPYQEMDLPAEPQLGEERSDMESFARDEGDEADGEAAPKSTRKRHVLFASRYLIAEV